MSTVSEQLKKGDLSGALEQARADVSAQPEDPGARFVLFEILALQEDYDAADAELKTLRGSAPAMAESLDFYAGLLAAERARHRFRHTGEGDVSFLAKPPSWAAAFAEAAVLTGKGEHQQAAAILKDAWKQVPAVKGWVDGVHFRSVRDADDVLGPFLEVVVPGRWAWIPFDQIESVKFEEPRGFQEVIWRPAEVEIRGGPKGRLWVPSVYSGTGARSDMEKLGRMTNFEYPEKGLCRGYGQRDLKIDDTMLMGILSIGLLAIDHGQKTGQTLN